MYAVVQKLIDNIRIELPGVTDPAINLQLYNTVDEFCRRTDGNRVSILIYPVVDERVYEVASDDVVVVRAFDIAHLTMPVNVALFDPNTSFLVLNTAPTSVDVVHPITLNVSAAPKPTATDPDVWMNELLWGRFYQALLDGVIMRLASQIAKPFSNKEKATFHGRRYRSRMASERVTAGVNFMPNASGWRFPVVRGG